MRKWTAGPWAAVVGILLFGSFLAFAYATLKRIPPDLVARVLPAALAELLLYFLVGSGAGIRIASRAPRPVAAAALWLSALLPYALFCVGGGVYRARDAAVLAVLAAASAFWFIVLPRSWAADLSFLGLMAGVVLMKPFRYIYSPGPALAAAGAEFSFLGQLMWIRLGIASIRWFRPQAGVNPGFWPNRREWAIGTLWFGLLMPAAAWMNHHLGFATMRTQFRLWPVEMAVAAGTFFGILWVVAYSEEFFFRGLLQQWLERWFSSRLLGLVGAALLFGSVHLAFRQFPNWNLALLAALAGVFYGLAFRHGGGIRAAMVTHALTVTVWRTFFR